MTGTSSRQLYGREASFTIGEEGIIRIMEIQIISQKAQVNRLWFYLLLRILCYMSFCRTSNSPREPMPDAVSGEMLYFHASRVMHVSSAHLRAQWVSLLTLR